MIVARSAGVRNDCGVAGWSIDATPQTSASRWGIALSRRSPINLAMSALGQTRRFREVGGMSGLPLTADISGPGRHFAFGPTADIVALGGGLIVGNTADNVGSAVQTAEEAGFLVVHVDEPT
jgi:hypothetical protein